jgi:anti-sigma B factor antagonist
MNAVPSHGQQFRLTPAKGEQPPVVIASGDIDLANVNEFHELMARAAETAEAITVDLSDVSYCDSAAVRALFSVAANTKLSLVVRAAGPITTLLSVSGLDRIATVTMADERA